MTNFLTSTLVIVTLWITGFLFLLNVVCAFLFRSRRSSEILSYLAVSLMELGIFVFVLLLRLGVLTHVPYHLPPGLPFDRAEMGAAIAVGIGLLPVAYWHRASSVHMRERIAKDAQEMQNRQAGVRVRSNAPGEWMN
ncbi:MAG TPA: hypothetical protein VKR83_18460 [Ktedonobacteraceae bacterium]|nr:hypothetical protein [Ktedonobacteraceae bacterium]